MKLTKLALCRFVVLHDERNLCGRTNELKTDWTPPPGDYWCGRIRSIKVSKQPPPIQPR